MASNVERVARLRATARECLAALDAAGPEEPEVGRAFAALQEGFEDLGDPAELLRAADADEREALERELSDLARVHAVLTATVARDQDRLGRLLERARAAQGAVRGVRFDAPTGGSCDVSA